MTRRRALRGVLHNFLGTWTSRYTDHRGYWLFGLLPADLETWNVDLLANPPIGRTPREVAHRLAVVRFDEQVHKAGLSMAIVRHAELRWMRGAEFMGRQGDEPALGHLVAVTAALVTDLGTSIEVNRTIFVAPHDPRRERRRATWATP